LFFGGGNCGL